MAFVQDTKREGYLKCDFPRCGAVSGPFVAELGGELPAGWLLVTRIRPGEPRLDRGGRGVHDPSPVERRLRERWDELRRQVRR